ncbi:MAG TPA: hypothetical protein VFS43_43020 [Polyangiaceae bacterium]|nr:hypothetical protein [Polyangiaceae bacterium]
MSIVRANRAGIAGRLLGRGALLALGTAAAYGCSAAELDADAGDASASAESGLEAAEFGTDPSPTPTPIPGPTPVLLYDAYINLDPGWNSKSATDDELKSPFRVKVSDSFGLTNGAVGVSVPAAYDKTTTSACASYGLEFTVEGYSALTATWSKIGEQNVTGVVRTTGGEFPTTYCDVDASVPVGSGFSQLRVTAKGRRQIFLNGVPVSLTQNTSVRVTGSTPVPDPGKKLHVTDIALNAAKTGASASVKNDGPQTATGVRATLKGSYAYCPPAAPGQSNYCVISGHPCEGFFCPNDVNPSGNQFWPHRAPKICQIDVQLHSWTASIGPGNSVIYSWPSSIVSDDSGCAPCNPSDGRCANVSLTVSTDSIDETDPWDTWDKASRTELYSGVNN